MSANFCCPDCDFELSTLSKEYFNVINTLARERDEFGKKETELAVKLRKAREGFLDIQEHCKNLSSENYRDLGAYQIAEKVLEEIQEIK